MEDKIKIETEEFVKEDDNMNKKINYSNKPKKTVFYIILGIIILVIIAIGIYLVLNSKSKDKETTEQEPEDKLVSEKVNKTEKVWQVACDDNTALLNVRNSVSGNIIDGLSCYKEVTVEEKLEGTDACKQWYKISYKKNNNNYTGYACGTYIKERDTIPNEDKITDVIAKAEDYFSNNTPLPYCGKTSETKNIEFSEGENSFTGAYLKSEYKTLKELENYLSSFIDSSLINLKLSDINNKKMYDNYYEIDGNLYCRNYSGTGMQARYTGQYELELSTITENYIKYNIAYKYLTSDSECNIRDLTKCSNSNFEYKLGKIELKINNDSYLITKIDFNE